MEPFELIRSDRRTISVEVRGDGRVIVRAPRRMPAADIQRFVDARTEWIRSHVEKMRQRQTAAEPPFSTQELKALAEAAAQDIPQRVARFAAQMGVSYGRITIRAQKTRWGSCTSQGNLNFNCLLMLCPEPVRDYVVVHELCHRKELNHSARFWQKVARVMPDYPARRQWLKEQGAAISRKLR